MWLLAMIAGVVIGLVAESWRCNTKIRYMQRVLRMREEQVIQRDAENRFLRAQVRALELAKESYQPYASG
jgi:hypothetical protein